MSSDPTSSVSRPHTQSILSLGIGHRLTFAYLPQDTEQPNIELVRAIDNLIDDVKSRFGKVTGDISVKCTICFFGLSCYAHKEVLLTASQWMKWESVWIVSRRPSLLLARALRRMKFELRWGRSWSIGCESSGKSLRMVYRGVCRVLANLYCVSYRLHSHSGHGRTLIMA